MAKGKDRDRRLEARWRRIIRDQGRSGLGVREFCRKSKLRESAFYFWRRELKLRARLQTAAQPFVELQVPVAAAAPLALELLLPQGLRLQIQRGCDLQLVRELLQELHDPLAADDPIHEGKPQHQVVHVPDHVLVGHGL